MRRKSEAKNRMSVVWGRQKYGRKLRVRKWQGITRKLGWTEIAFAEIIKTYIIEIR